MGLLKRTKSSSARPEAPVSPERMVLVTMPARVQPMHRVEIYEDPLQRAYDEHLPGCQVGGGGSQLDREHGVLSCDIEIELVGDIDRAIAVTVKALEHFGAPVGSTYRVGDAEQVPFGRTHGLCLSIDGTSLPQEVYDDNDVNELIEALVNELEGIAVLQSWWEGPTRTRLYFYGDDPDRIRPVLESAADRFPLAQRSRVEPIT